MALSYSELYVVTPAQAANADALEAAIDVAIQAQADPGEQAFLFNTGNNNGASDPVVRQEVGDRYELAGWSIVQWQFYGTSWYLVLVN